MRIRKGDKVKILAGKDGGKTGTVLTVDHEKNRVIVEGLNLAKKHLKKQQGDKDEGGIVSIPLPIPVSRVQLVCAKCNKPTRVQLERTKGKVVRVCKKCKSPIDKTANN